MGEGFLMCQTTNGKDVKTTAKNEMVETVNLFYN